MLKRSRIGYWSSSKFANWIRGEKKPKALTLEEWEDWRKNSKSKHPYKYWFTEKFLNKLQNLVCFPGDVLYTIKVYIRNRYISKIHYLKTGLKPGEYYDLDHRILYGVFNELVDFVEIEYAHLSKFYKDRNYKFIKGRCAQAGIDHLEWASNLTYGAGEGVTFLDKLYGQPTHQAKSAQKISELYNWWKNRDNRPDPYDLFTKEKDGKYYYRKIGKMNDDYDKEDDKMLIELMKIRRHLWT
jgi:hypothetical protein